MRDSLKGCDWLCKHTHGCSLLLKCRAPGTASCLNRTFHYHIRSPCSALFVRHCFPTAINRSSRAESELRFPTVRFGSHTLLRGREAWHRPHTDVMRTYYYYCRCPAAHSLPGLSGDEGRVDSDLFYSLHEMKIADLFDHLFIYLNFEKTHTYQSKWLLFCAEAFCLRQPGL